MRHIACQNDECDNKGAPYHDHEPDETIILCGFCNKAMAVIPDPTAADSATLEPETPPKKRRKKP